MSESLMAVGSRFEYMGECIVNLREYVIPIETKYLIFGLSVLFVLVYLMMLYYMFEISRHNKFLKSKNLHHAYTDWCDDRRL